MIMFGWLFTHKMVFRRNLWIVSTSNFFICFFVLGIGTTIHLHYNGVCSTRYETHTDAFGLLKFVSFEWHWECMVNDNSTSWLGFQQSSSLMLSRSWVSHVACIQLRWKSYSTILFELILRNFKTTVFLLSEFPYSPDAHPHEVFQTIIHLRSKSELMQMKHVCVLCQDDAFLFRAILI